MSTLKVNAIRNTSATSDAITLASDGTATAKITNNLSNRNVIINGEMQICQRGNVTGVTGSSWGGPDRFEFRESADSTSSINQSTESPDGFSKSYHVDITTADAAIAAGHFIGFRYQAEGYDVQRFAKGTSSAKAGVLSFYVKTNKTGTYAVNLYDNSNTRHFSDTYTVSDTNWNRYSIAVPADTTGAFAVNGNGALEILWLLSAGTDITSGSSPTAWAAYSAPVYAAGHNVNFADSTSNDFYITGIQLEVDSTNSGKPSDYEHRSYSDELNRCLRYYYRMPYKSGTFIGVGTAWNSDSSGGTFSVPVPMRVSPTFTVNAGGDFETTQVFGDTQTCSAVSMPYGSSFPHNMMSWRGEANGNHDTGEGYILRFKDGQTSGYISLDSEH